MVSGPKERLVVRHIDKQLHDLEQASKALGPAHAKAWVESDVPAGYDGLVAVPRIDNFGIYQIPASSEAWGKTVGWPLHTRIKGLTDSPRTFDPSSFVLDARTAEAFAKLDEAQRVMRDRHDENRVRVFPVRFSSEATPALGDDEFFLDLGSLMWLLVTHPKWKRDEMLLRCLGERYKDHPSLLVGYKGYQRWLAWRDEPYDGLTVIGRVPS